MTGSGIMRRLITALFTAGLFAGFGLVALKGRLIGAEIASGEEFKPIKEAEMPKGFPGYSPVGQIEVKQYPAYRKASASGMAEFWTLFQHIKQNNVTMTAPVEMDYGDPRATKSKERSMSFLYERTDQGSTGKQGSVEVVDVPAMTVVSIGCRGARTGVSISEAREKLVKWLDEKKVDYVAIGPMRIMGYNSPFVPRDKNFFEVQIPIRAATVSSTGAPRKD
jgi:hypothetical protein